VSARIVGRPPTLAEVMALAAGIGVFAYLGWDGALWSARLQALLHLLAFGAVAGLILLGWRGGLLPRTRIDLPILLLLVVIGAAAVVGENPGLSGRAFAASLGTAAMLPVGLVALRHRSSWVGLVVCIPVLLLAAGTLAYMIPRRVEWLVNHGPGILAPARLAEGTPFGSVAVPPFVILAALPLTYLIDHAATRRLLQGGLLTVGVPLALVSGSRSAWLAIGVAVLVMVLALRPRLRRPRPLTVMHLVAAVGVLTLAAVGLLAIVPRLTAVTSLIYRGELWRDTLAAVGDDVLLGIGPGSMPFARMAAAEPLSLPVSQPHSHNLPLGLYGDAGLIGLVAGLLLVLAFFFVAGPWRQRTPVGRGAVAVLAGFAVAGLFEDLTFLPNFNLLVLLLVGVALREAGMVHWFHLSAPRVLIVAGAVAALVLASITVVGDGARMEYQRGIEAARAGDWSLAQQRLTRSERLDSWHPAASRALAVAASMNDDTETVRAAARRAVERNPGDGPSWMNLSLACLQLGDEDCAAEAADQAVARARAFGLELLNAALVYERLGRTEAADEAYRLSLLTNHSTGVAFEWSRPIDPGEQPMAGLGATQAELNLLVARASQGETIEPRRLTEPVTRSLAHELRGETAEADRALADAMASQPESVVTWDLAVLIGERRGLDTARERRLGQVIRGSALTTEAGGIPGLTFDVGTFRVYPLDGYVRQAQRLIPDPPWPWVLEALIDDD
jgi:tetratricopeptide (TPR) repeat protein